VTSCNETGLMLSIMFDCIDHMHLDLLVVRAWVATKSRVFECRKFINHEDLGVFCIDKFCVTLTTINRHRLFMVARCLEATHVNRLGREQMKLSMIGMAKDTAHFCVFASFLSPGNFQPLASRRFFAGINRDSNRVRVVDTRLIFAV